MANVKTIQHNTVTQTTTRRNNNAMTIVGRTADDAVVMDRSNSHMTAGERMELTQIVGEIIIGPELYADDARVRLLSEFCAMARESVLLHGGTPSHLLVGLAGAVKRAILAFPTNNSTTVGARNVAIDVYFLAATILDVWSTNLIVHSTGGTTRRRVVALENLCVDLSEKQLANLRIDECQDERTGRRYGDAACRRGLAVKIGSGGRHKGSRYAYQLWAVWS
jgi:hypothetical protein